MTTTTDMKAAIEFANSRGVGQFHVFVAGAYQTTWHTFISACAVAEKYGGIVRNADGAEVFPTEALPTISAVNIAVHNRINDILKRDLEAR